MEAKETTCQASGSNYRKTWHAHRKNSKRQFKSRSAAKPIACSIFRPYLLKYNPTIKSGFLLPDYGFADDIFLNKFYVIEIWHNLLKEHSKYKTLLIEENDSLDDILLKLHAITCKLFNGYKWILKIDDEYSAHKHALYYYKNFGEAEWHMCPLDWLFYHKDANVRNSGIELIKRIAKAFGIDAVENYNTEYELAEWEKSEELHEYLVDNVGYNRFKDDGNEEADYIKVYNLYWSYKHGEIQKLRRSFHESFENGELQIEDGIKKIKDPKIRKWLLSGFKLLNDTVKISNFSFTKLIEDQDERPVSIDETTFFPFSYKDPIYESAENILDEIAGNNGLQSYYEWGCLAKGIHELPFNFQSLKKLFDFMDQGHEIYVLHYQDKTY